MSSVRRFTNAFLSSRLITSRLGGYTYSALILDDLTLKSGNLPCHPFNCRRSTWTKSFNHQSNPNRIETRRSRKIKQSTTSPNPRGRDRKRYTHHPRQPMNHTRSAHHLLPSPALPCIFPLLHCTLNPYMLDACKYCMYSHLSPQPSKYPIKISHKKTASLDNTTNPELPATSELASKKEGRLIKTPEAKFM